MKLKKTLLITLPVLTVIMELLPFGAVMNFANPEGQPWRMTYSYFSLIPFGYANFGPLITAVLSSALLILAVISAFKYSKGLNIAILNLSGITAAVSLTPILYGLDFISVTGVIITVLLLAEFFVALFNIKK